MTSADPEALRPFIPAGGAARVLITSDAAVGGGPGDGIPVDVFSAEEALAFLAGRTGLDDEAGAAAVAAELGHLPLALAQAARGDHAGSARGTGHTWSGCSAMPAEEYLTRRTGSRTRTASREAVLLSLAGGPGGRSRRDVRPGHGRSSRCCRRPGSAGTCCMPPGRRACWPAAGIGSTAALVDQALERLADRSLLTFSLDGQTVIMHRLVAQVVRNGLASRERLMAVCRAAASVLEAHAQALAGSQDRPAVRDIPEQVAALLDNAAGLAGRPMRSWPELCCGSGSSRCIT